MDRFINADVYISTGQGILGCNMFAYCNNNPVCMADYNGEDAIYVVDTGKDGLPIVGHAILFIQDADGNWYKTHFSGKTFWDAQIWTIPVDEEYIDKTLSRSGVSHIYISGDFSASYKLAQQYNDTKYGGYCLLTNNCLHYAKELLRAGSPDNTSYIFWFNGTQISPMRFYFSLLSCRFAPNHYPMDSARCASIRKNEIRRVSYV